MAFFIFLFISAGLGSQPLDGGKHPIGWSGYGLGLGAKIAQRIASWTWDPTHERALSPADLFGGKAPVGAFIGLLERIR